MSIGLATKGMITMVGTGVGGAIVVGGYEVSIESSSIGCDIVLTNPVVEVTTVATTSVDVSLGAIQVAVDTTDEGVGVEI